MDGRMMVSSQEIDYEQKTKDAIDDLYANIEGRNLDECVQQFQRVRDYLERTIKALES